jgi:fructokinase
MITNCRIACIANREACFYSVDNQNNEESLVRIGIDLGGTKTEVIALSEQGEQLFRHRLPTPRDDYHQTIETIARLVEMAEQATGQTGSVGMGIPGSISPYTGVVKNANSTWLNGQPFDKDLSASEPGSASGQRRQLPGGL